MTETRTQKQQAKLIEAVTPYLDSGDTVKAVVVGQTPIPPLLYLLVAPMVLIFLIKLKTVVATDRNVYVLANHFMRNYKFHEDPYRTPLDAAKVEFGKLSLRVDGGPRIWIWPFRVDRSRLKQLAEYLRGAGAQAQGAGPQARPPGG